MNTIFCPEITDTYDIIGEIGQGGGGTVFEAYHKRLRKKVVIKRQHDSIRGLVNERTETDTLKNLRHSNLPQVLDFIVTKDAVYTVMDYIPGQSVKEILKEKGKLDEKTVIAYAKQLCEALVYLHNSKPPVIHGDIKPDNIMITPDEDVCLIDFNISSALGAANSYAFGYTLGYAAPEQRKSFEYERDRIRRTKATTGGESLNAEIIRNDAPTELMTDLDKTEVITGDERTELIDRDGQNSGAFVNTGDLAEGEKAEKGIFFDKRSDIFSFGATLYHMLTGNKPSSDLDKVKPVMELYPMMNRGLADIITRSMYINPADRFQSFEEIKKILDHINRYDLAYRARMIRRLVIIAFAAVVAGLAIAVGFTRLRRSSENRYKEGLDEAMSLYYAMDYEQSINKINDDLLDGHYFDMDDSFSADAYYIRGNDWLELGEYEQAIADFDRSYALDSSRVQIYQDKAVALARSGNTKEALRVIEDARESGVDTSNLLLAQAEIEAAEGNTEQAIRSYMECAEKIDSDPVKARAYLLCADLYDLSDPSGLREAIIILEKASVIESGLQAGVFQKLAQCYLNLADISGDTEEFDKALSVFNQIIEKGWDTYTTHNNIAVIYDQMGDLDAASAELHEMLDKYGDQYNTYKRLAFIEIEQQNRTVSDERDYSAFLGYADKASELYKTQNQIVDDMEMNVLYDLIKQVR